MHAINIIVYYRGSFSSYPRGYYVSYGCRYTYMSLQTNICVCI